MITEQNKNFQVPDSIIFYAQWILVTSAGLSIYSWPESGYSEFVPFIILSLAIPYISIGFLTGIGQFILLRSKVHQASGWIFLSTVAFTVSPVIGSITPIDFFPELWIQTLKGGITGSLIGLIQLPLLGRWVKGSTWWVLATALGGALFYTFMGDIPVFEDRGSSGILAGIATGAAITYFLFFRSKNNLIQVTQSVLPIQIKWMFATISLVIVGGYFWSLVFYFPELKERGWTTIEPVLVIEGQLSRAEGGEGDYVRAMTIDRQGRLWASTKAGLNVLQLDGSWVNLNSSRIDTLATDKQGNIWVKIDDTDQWLVYSSDGELITSNIIQYAFGNDFVSALAFDSEGNAWVGAGDGANNLRILSPDGLQKAFWIGRINGQLSRLTSDELDKANAEDDSSLIDIFIKDLTIDKNDQAWVGGIEGYVMGIAPDGSLQTTPRLSGGLWSLAIDQQGNIWAGSSNGLSTLNSNGKWMTYTTSTSVLTFDDVRALTVDEKGRIWVATRGTSNSITEGVINVIDPLIAFPPSRVDMGVKLSLALSISALFVFQFILNRRKSV